MRLPRGLRWLKRLRGFDTPFGGVSFEPPTDEAEIARRLVNYLQDRRVLYAPIDRENPNHSIQSVLMMREYLTELLQEASPDSKLAEHLDRLRIACRDFCDAADAFLADGGNLWIGRPIAALEIDPETGVRRELWRREPTDEPDFSEALEALRSTFAEVLFEIAARYKLKIGSPLSGILNAQ